MEQVNEEKIEIEEQLEERGTRIINTNDYRATFSSISSSFSSTPLSQYLTISSPQLFIRIKISC